MTQKAEKVRNAKFANKSFLQKSGNGKTCTFCHKFWKNYNLDLLNISIVFLKQMLPCSTSKSFPTQEISLVKPLGICLCKSLTLISLSLRLSLPNISSQTSLEFTSRLANFNVDSTAYFFVLGSYFNPHPAKLTNSPRKS